MANDGNSSYMVGIAVMYVMFIYDCDRLWVTRKMKLVYTGSNLNNFIDQTAWNNSMFIYQL